MDPAELVNRPANVARIRLQYPLAAAVALLPHQQVAKDVEVQRNRTWQRTVGGFLHDCELLPGVLRPVSRKLPHMFQHGLKRLPVAEIRSGDGYPLQERQAIWLELQAFQQQSLIFLFAIGPALLGHRLSQRVLARKIAWIGAKGVAVVSSGICEPPVVLVQQTLKRLDRAVIRVQGLRLFEICGGLGRLVQAEVQQTTVRPRGRLLRNQLDRPVEFFLSENGLVHVQRGCADIERLNVFLIARRTWFGYRRCLMQPKKHS